MANPTDFASIPDENELAQVDRDLRFDDVLRAGEMSIHSDLLLHSSNQNDSNRRRCGLTLRYCTPDVRAGSDWNQKGVVVNGSDPEHHWANPARPETE